MANGYTYKPEKHTIEENIDYINRLAKEGFIPMAIILRDYCLAKNLI